MTLKGTLLTIESLAELASVHRPPCLSPYQPMHRHRPENQQDPIRFRNLLKKLELVGKMGGRVLVIPAERMPGRTGLAATCRY
jgi:hypothetical protein